MTLNNFDEFIDKTDYLQTRLLQVNSCGSERVVKYDYTILRSNGRRDFHFLYLQNGWLDIEVGTAKARLSRGQCAVFLPNVRQMYSFTAAGDPVSLYLHFTGQAAAEAMQYLRPTENMIYTISDQTLFESLFHRLNRLHNLQRGQRRAHPQRYPQRHGIYARAHAGADQFPDLCRDAAPELQPLCASVHTGCRCLAAAVSAAPPA